MMRFASPSWPITEHMRSFYNQAVSMIGDSQRYDQAPGVHDVAEVVLEGLAVLIREANIDREDAAEVVHKLEVMTSRTMEL